MTAIAIYHVDGAHYHKLYVIAINLTMSPCEDLDLMAIAIASYIVVIAITEMLTDYSLSGFT